MTISLTNILQAALPQGPSGYSGYSGSGISGYSGFSGLPSTSISVTGAVATYANLSVLSPSYKDIWYVTENSHLYFYNNDSTWIDLGAVMGTSGFSGYSGSGISGFSGTSGYSGISGYSGKSGFSGMSGYSGSGISGYSGTSGFSGINGDGITVTTGNAPPEAPVDGALWFDSINGMMYVYWAADGVWVDKSTLQNSAPQYIIYDGCGCGSSIIDNTLDGGSSIISNYYEQLSIDSGTSNSLAYTILDGGSGSTAYTIFSTGIDAGLSV